MIKLALPVTGSASAQVATCFEEIRQEFYHSIPATRQVLQSVESQLFQRIEAYVCNGAEPRSTGPTPFPRQTNANASGLPAVGELLFSRYRSGGKTDKDIVAHAKRVSVGYCPYCGLYLRRKPGETSADRDHVRPRSLFPEFSLLRLNLVMSCDDCNDAKSDRDVDAHGDWLFLHPYFDDFLAERLIEAQVSAENGKPAVSFCVRGGLAPTIRDRVGRHIGALDLFARFGDDPLREAMGLLEVHQAYVRAGDSNVETVRCMLRDQGAKRLSARPNDPLGCILLALADAKSLGDILT